MIELAARVEGLAGADREVVWGFVPTDKEAKIVEELALRFACSPAVIIASAIRAYAAAIRARADG